MKFLGTKILMLCGLAVGTSLGAPSSAEAQSFRLQVFHPQGFQHRGYQPGAHQPGLHQRQGFDLRARSSHQLRASYQLRLGPGGLHGVLVADHQQDHLRELRAPGRLDRQAWGRRDSIRLERRWPLRLGR